MKTIKRTYTKGLVTYYGGKQTMLKHIIPMIPEHKSYGEPFFGGGAVFFAKKEAKCEMINDTNGNVINFYRVYQTKRKKLFELIKSSLLSRQLSESALEIYLNPSKYSDIKRAWAFWFLSNTCFMGDLFGKIKFSKSKERSYKFLQSSKDTFMDPKTIARIEKTQIDCRDALLVIQAMDSVYCFFYIDPPYIDSDQGHYGGYTKIKFARLLVTLSRIKGKFLLSSYPGPLIELACKKYNWQFKKIKLNSAGSALHGQRGEKVEMLSWNYNTVRTLDLF